MSRGVVARVTTSAFLFAIRGYRATLSVVLGPCCRFEPSCSAYAEEAVLRHGFWRGGWLTVWRLLRCQPLCTGGHDPVPPARASRTSERGLLAPGVDERPFSRQGRPS